MLGAIIGDIVGSTREWHNIKTEKFELVPGGSRFTDDTVMTLAVSEWLMTDPKHGGDTLVACMQRLGRKYPRAGYGWMFKKWLASDNPQPYGSYGNGSAMRVSPVGLYATSLDEALELARISAMVTHNHPEGIKGAQAVAACIYMRRMQSVGDPDPVGYREIKDYVERTFGYDLSVNLEDMREHYSFDPTCQGSVPVAIMAFLQRRNAVDTLRLAVSMGGDSDTIGCMAASIAMACPPYESPQKSIPVEVVEKCRKLLPADLLDINDRFEAFISRPLRQSFVVDGEKLFAGEYPGDKDRETAENKIENMLHFGVRHFIDLTEEGELKPYSYLLPEGVTYFRFPIKDCGVPESAEEVHRLLRRMDELKKTDGITYLHCWGGTGRTGIIVACHLAGFMEHPTLDSVLGALRNKFSAMPKAAYRQTPDTGEQIDFIARFIESCPQYKREK